MWEVRERQRTATESRGNQRSGETIQEGEIAGKTRTFGKGDGGPKGQMLCAVRGLRSK